MHNASLYRIEFYWQNQSVWSILGLKAHFRARKFPRTENFPKMSLLKVEIFQLQNFFSDGKFVSANHILQNFLSAENFPGGNAP
jgi:hypothetical protein